MLFTIQSHRRKIWRQKAVGENQLPEAVRTVRDLFLQNPEETSQVKQENHLVLIEGIFLLKGNPKDESNKSV